MELLIGSVGLLLGYFLNNYILTVDENEKGDFITPSFDKYKSPVIFLWNALLPILVFRFFGGVLQPDFFRYAVLIIFSSAVFFIDFRIHIIPNILNYSVFLIGVIILFFDKINIADNLIGAVFGFGFFFLIIMGSRIILKRDGMGMGDAKFMAVVGIMLGFSYTVAVTVLSFIFGAVGATIVLLRRKKGLGQEIAFGPYIVMASVVMIFFGELLFKLYFGI